MKNNKILITLSVFCVLLIAGAAFGGSYFAARSTSGTQSSDQVQQLQQAIIAIETKIDALPKRIPSTAIRDADLASDVSETKQEMSEIKKAIDDMKTDLRRIKSDVSEIDLRLGY